MSSRCGERVSLSILFLTPRRTCSHYLPPRQDCSALYSGSPLCVALPTATHKACEAPEALRSQEKHRQDVTCLINPHSTDKSALYTHRLAWRVTQLQTIVGIYPMWHSAIIELRERYQAAAKIVPWRQDKELPNVPRPARRPRGFCTYIGQRAKAQS